MLIIAGSHVLSTPFRYTRMCFPDPRYPPWPNLDPLTASSSLDAYIATHLQRTKLSSTSNIALCCTQHPVPVTVAQATCDAVDARPDHAMAACYSLPIVCDAQGVLDSREAHKDQLLSEQVGSVWVVKWNVWGDVWGPASWNCARQTRRKREFAELSGC